jgi:hypothetical protein
MTCTFKTVSAQASSASGTTIRDFLHIQRTPLSVAYLRERRSKTNMVCWSRCSRIHWSEYGVLDIRITLSARIDFVIDKIGRIPMTVPQICPVFARSPLYYMLYCYERPRQGSRSRNSLGRPKVRFSAADLGPARIPDQKNRLINPFPVSRKPTRCSRVHRIQLIPINSPDPDFFAVDMILARMPHSYLCKRA